MSKVSKENKKNSPLNPIKKGEVRNPNGYPKGMKNARTIVREFMDKQIDTISGTKVTRFQYLLWSMYEVSVRLEKQAQLRYNFLQESRAQLEEARQLFEAGEVGESKVDKFERKVKKDSTDYEGLLEKIQNSNGKLSEFLLKASGQYQEKISVEKLKPVIIEVAPEDIKQATEELEGEF